MYISSDNTYPSYNEEHGFWIQDETAIGRWKGEFWEELWKKSYGTGELSDWDKKTDEQLEKEKAEKQQQGHH